MNWCLPPSGKSATTQINNFEKMLTENNVCILKFFLHMSSKEQQQAFRRAPGRSPQELESFAGGFQGTRILGLNTRPHMRMPIAKCGTKEAPWYVIPSDHKWFRNFAVAEVIIRTLESFKMHYPKAK